MRVLVTGGTGFLGSHLIERLLEEPGVEVYALVRDPSRLRWLEGIERVRLLTGDLESAPALPGGLACVYHLAGLTKTLRSREYYTVNRDGTANLLRALDAQSGRPRFVYLSSLAAVGPSAPGSGVREDDPPRPVSPYGESKLQAEREILKYRDRFFVVILRAGAVYGPRDEDFLEYFRWIKRGIQPLLGRRKSLSLVFVRDAVRAAILAGHADLPSGEVFNIADPKPCGWEDIGRIASWLLGKRPVSIHLPIWSAYLASAASEGIGRILGGGSSVFNISKVKQMKPDGWVADIGKARQGLGFETRFTLDRGLGETIAWYLWKGLI
jgi:dihydroflavonol-4-reductase